MKSSFIMVVSVPYIGAKSGMRAITIGHGEGLVIRSVYYLPSCNANKFYWLVLSVRQVNVIIHEEKYGGITLFIHDRKLWFNFILVAWNGLDPPCRGTWDASCATPTLTLRTRSILRGRQCYGTKGIGP